MGGGKQPYQFCFYQSVVRSKSFAHLLSIDDLKPLLHLATLCAPALLIGDQGHVGMLWDAVVTCAAVNTPSIVLIAQIIIAATRATSRLRKRFAVQL